MGTVNSSSVSYNKQRNAKAKFAKRQLKTGAIHRSSIERVSGKRTAKHKRKQAQKIKFLERERAEKEVKATGQTKGTEVDAMKE